MALERNMTILRRMNEILDLNTLTLMIIINNKESPSSTGCSSKPSLFEVENHVSAVSAGASSLRTQICSRATNWMGAEAKTLNFRSKLRWIFITKNRFCECLTKDLQVRQTKFFSTRVTCVQWSCLARIAAKTPSKSISRPTRMFSLSKGG